MKSLLIHLSMYILVTSMSQLLYMLLQCMLVWSVVQSLLLSCKTQTVPMRHSVPFPLPQPLVPIILVSVSMEPIALGALYEWTQTSFVLPCLPYVTEHDVFRVHPLCSLSELPSFQAGQHSLCCWTTFCLSILLLRDMWNIFIHLSPLVVFVEKLQKVP